MFETLKKIFSKGYELTEDTLVLREKVNIGIKLKEIVSRQDYKTLEEYVLVPLQISAFETFKKVDASDTIQVVEAQMMSKIIDAIRREIEIKINQGMLAEKQLKELEEINTED
ncbi:MAG: hypothetical protein Q8O68_00940 [Candidatus Daviesbacteria bacterium]|nr:hypothetical protein [Candidatus Daviesbacteria bacterium]